MIPLGVLGASRTVEASGGGLSLVPGAYSGSSGTTVTTSTVDIGPASATRTVVIGLASTGSLNRDCTAMTIGGVSATRDVSSGSVRAGAHIFRATVPTGTSVDVVTTWSSTGHAFQFKVYASTAAVSLIDTDGDMGDGARTTITATPDTAAGGVIVAVASAGSGSSISSVSFDADLTSTSSVVGREDGSGSPVPVSVTFDGAPSSAYGRIVAACYA